MNRAECSRVCQKCQKRCPVFKMLLTLNRNQRERNRVLNINETYAKLQKVVPFTKPKDSKLKILTLAMKYISTLKQQLEEPVAIVQQQPTHEIFIPEPLSDTYLPELSDTGL